MRLTEASLGATVRIVFITPRSKKRLEKLSALGIVPGSKVRLLQRNPSFVLEIGQTTEAPDPIPAIVAKELRIRWLPVPMEPTAKVPSVGEMPVPDDAALRRIAGMV